MHTVNIQGNIFQRDLCTQFNKDILSSSAGMANVRGKEKLIYDYITNVRAIFEPERFIYDGNPSGMYSNYGIFKRDFVNYWRRALDLSRDEKTQIENIFDEALIGQEMCKNIATVSVYFENGKALLVKDCLYAIYEVIELV